MASASAVHSRSHSLLLVQKLLNLKDGASPLTLVLDSLEQPSQPVLTEIITRAKVTKNKIIYLSFATLRRPEAADAFVKAAGKDPKLIQKELLSHYPVFNAAAGREKPAQRAVVIIDSVNNLCSAIPQSLALFLSGILTPAVSIMAVYHTDVPVILPKTFSEYEPHPFTILCHLATAILTLSNLQQEIERQKARNRSVVEPEWGLKEDREGVVHGLQLKGDASDDGGVVVSMELRRRSGRTVSEKFILLRAQYSQSTIDTKPMLGKILLLTDHATFRSPADQGDAGIDDEEPESTFNLGLTEKQRKDRDGIVLPYFDAQTDIGAGEGGRILYEMGREDDFDEEEDEI